MKRLFSIILVLIFVSSFAQTNDDEYFDPNYKNWSNGLSMDTSKTKQKIKYKFSTGASVTSGFNGGSAVNTWVAPSVLIPVNNRLSIETGLVYGKGFYNNYNAMPFYGDNSFGNINGDISTVSYYIKGNYKINENLTITGATYGSKVIRTTPVNPANPQAFNLDNNGYMIGFNYKFRNGSEMNLELNLQQGNSPMQMSPFSRGASFGASPYGNTFGMGFGQ